MYIYDDPDFQKFYSVIYEVRGPRLERYLSEIPLGSRVLDVACGSGKIALAFATERSASVTGIDLSPSFSANSALLAHERQLPCHFMQGDMRDFNLNETFDVVACLGNSLNNVPDFQDMLRALACMKRHLAPKGKLLIGLHSFNARIASSERLGKTIDGTGDFYGFELRGKLSFKDGAVWRGTYRHFIEQDGLCIFERLEETAIRFPTITEFKLMLQISGFKIERYTPHLSEEFEDCLGLWVCRHSDN